jgi:hypothetical protein
MYTSKDRMMLEQAYNKTAYVKENHGIPVMVSMAMPGVEVDHSDHSHSGESSDSDEVSMAAGDLMRIADEATALSQKVGSMSNLEGWVAAKITKAADYISSVSNYLEYGDAGCGCESESDMFDQGHESASCKYAKQGCTCGGCEDCHD